MTHSVLVHPFNDTIVQTAFYIHTSKDVLYKYKQYVIKIESHVSGEKRREVGARMIDQTWFTVQHHVLFAWFQAYCTQVTSYPAYIY